MSPATVIRRILFLFVIACVLGRLDCQADERPRTDPAVAWRQDQDPEIVEHYAETIWPDEMQSPWLRSLALDESDLRREAADTILLATKLGLEPKQEFEGLLLAVASDPKEITATRLSATKALISCGFRSAAESLAGQIDQVPYSMRVMIEQALSEWQYEPMGDMWLARLNDLRADPLLFDVAVEGVAGLARVDAIPVLKNIVVSDEVSLKPRLVAAGGWGRICLSHGAEIEDLILTTRMFLEQAKSDRSPELLIGVRLAVQPSIDSSGKQALVALLERYADQNWNVIKADALGKLLAVEPAAVLDRAETNVADADANVRRITVNSLALDIGQRSVVLLGKALGDPVPDIRRTARKHLLAFATDEKWRTAVVDEANGILGSESWRGIEQSLILLTQLENRAARSRIVSLTDHPRPEVFITASWSLKTLAEPDWADQLYDLMVKKFDTYVERRDFQFAYAASHLMEAMGMLEHRKALPLLRKCVPKGAPYPIRMRCAAIWAIGFLGDPNADGELQDQLVERLLDYSSIPPEEPPVRAVAAVALGRMKARGCLEILEDRARQEGRGSLVGSRAHWAVSQITGEPMPAAPTIERIIGGWTLQSAGGVVH